MSLKDSAPIYVTRKTADGDTGAYSMTLWMTLFAIMLVWINVMLWSIIGIITAVKVVI